MMNDGVCLLVTYGLNEEKSCEAHNKPISEVHIKDWSAAEACDQGMLCSWTEQRETMP